MHEPIHTMLWQRIDQPGAEYCALHQQDDGWQVAGVVTVALGGAPLLVRYEVVAGDRWQTRRVDASLTSRDGERRLRLEVDDQGRWWLDGAIAPELDGCVDIDLGITPATNTLPIRRLGLAVGESREIDAAWVRFPDLSVARLPQRYTRLAERRYRYASRTFTAELEVNDAGLTLDYAGVWTAVGFAST